MAWGAGRAQDRYAIRTARRSSSLARWHLRHRARQTRSSGIGRTARPRATVRTACNTGSACHTDGRECRGPWSDIRIDEPFFKCIIWRLLSILNPRISEKKGGGERKSRSLSRHPQWAKQVSDVIAQTAFFPSSFPSFSGGRNSTSVIFRDLHRSLPPSPTAPASCCNDASSTLPPHPWWHWATGASQSTL